MIILRAIGRFFARIGRWIRDTAWVQPLLIVGGIFAIIFSIPYITKWVQSWFDSSNAAQSFFNEYKISLDDADKGTSKADGLFKYLTGETDKEQGKKEYGEKFFIMLTKESCEGCQDVYKGLKYLRDNWNKNEFSTGDEFRMYSLFVDTTNSDDKNMFQEYFYNSYDIYFEELASSMTLAPYYANKGGSTSSYATNIDSLGDPEAMSVPTLFYVDVAYNETAPQKNTLKITEILFTVDAKDTQGSADLGRARTLFDCWNHEKGTIFSSDYNQDN